MIHNTILRLGVFFLGIPGLVLSAFLFPQAGLPVFAAIAIGASALGAQETARLFPRRQFSYRGNLVVTAILGAAVPAAGYLAYLVPNTPPPPFVVMGTIMLLMALIMAIQVFRDHDGDYAGIMPTVTTYLFVLVYPGLFVWHALRLVALPNPSFLIVLFLLATYLNDSSAWLFGRLLGKRTARPGAPPPVAISPNKSIAGFVGGFFASPLVIIVAGIFFPEILPGPVISRLLFGMVIGAATITGDLVESAFKRSAAIKDSGQLIPGRGGLLDSIDSSLFAAPFFYYGYVLVFTGA
jgi:phosphatidate cytidylyltransferase